MKQNLELKQKQRLHLSMKLWLPLLQCPLHELEKHFRTLAEENPYLEVNSGLEIPEGSSRSTHEAFRDSRNHAYRSSGDPADWVSIATQSLYEKLEEQIEEPLFPTPISQMIARQIVSNINDAGYFEGEIEEIARRCDTTPSMVEQVRRRFAYLEPYGVGAIDYRESFLFQLNEFELDGELEHLLKDMIVHFESLQPFLEHPRFHDAKKVLRHLKNPPAIMYLPSEPPILPDLSVRIEESELTIEINHAVYPDLKVTGVGKEESFAKRKLKEARELVRLLDLRKKTLYNITLVLIEQQYDFFRGGSLKPLKLADVARILGFNESTISRAISEKYLRTERGIYAFKDFFSNAIGQVSTSEIKSYLRKTISGEERENPYSDTLLHAMVQEHFGIRMVRRSIVKYRQELNIPSAKERKFLYQVEDL